jgi:hypothetical protein
LIAGIGGCGELLYVIPGESAIVYRSFKGRFVLSKALLTHAINIIQQNADTVRYFQPTHEHVINSDASIVLLKKIRRNLRSHLVQPGEVPNQQTPPAICPHFDTWTIIGKDNEVQYKIPVCLCRGKLQAAT